MPDRELTGAYVRVQRNGNWLPVDITDLSQEELDEFFTNQPDSVKWVKFLVDWIQKNVAGFNHDSEETRASKSSV